jgi:hypothetical protein
MIRLILSALLMLAATVANADITIRNFNGFSTGTVATVMKYDDGNNAVDAHDGMILQGQDGVYYLLGTSYSCGFEYLNASTNFCGFNVYSSTDLGYNKKWHLEGKLFDASPAFWQNRCGGGNGCFEVKAIWNPNTSLYVFWFNQEGATSSPDNSQVFTCATPICGATPTVPGTPTFQTEPSHLAHGPVSSSQALFVDPFDNSCYIFYNDGVGARSNWIEKLNSACTDSASVSSVDTNVKGEGSGFFVRSGVYYALSGSLCAYCSGGATTVYSSASSVSGTYSSSNQISSISCNGQIQSVSTLTAGGTTTYLYGADQWTGSNNEGGATIYYKPLTFTSTAIDALTCDTTVTVAGVTPGTASPAVPSNADQTSVDIGYHDTCDVNSSNWRMQTFVPTQAVSTIYMPLAKNIVTGNLTVSLTTVDGSNNPVTTLSSKTYTASDINSAGTWTAIPIHTATPGSTYAIVLSSDASAGCYSVPIFFGSFTNPYTSGVERWTSNSGASWNTESSRALMFATVPPTAGVGRFIAGGKR